MVARSRPEWQRAKQPDDWRTALRDAVHDLPTLCQRLDLDADLAVAGHQAARNYRLHLPRAWLDLIEPGNPHDPLLRQILPTAAETDDKPGFGPDPVGDLAAEHPPGVLHKYRGRALLLTTGACAIHCRYCFRRSFPFTAGINHPARSRQALEAIANNSAIREVILSGGDPLLLNNHSLTELLKALDKIPHLARIRLHSRAPIVLPERIDGPLCQILEDGRLPRICVVQVNHPKELGPAAASALERLRSAGISLLNQSVLLQGVNDQADILCALSEKLFSFGVLPYYLHRLDRVAGAAHFELPIERCNAIMDQVRAELPGYLAPRFVMESAGASSKTPL